MTQLGLAINAALAVPNQGRLGTIIRLIDRSDMSIHYLSRVEVSRGVPRFNMPVELGLALYRSHITKGKHRIFIFERKQHRAQRSTSDVNGIDPQIHNGTIKGLMGALRNIFRQPQDVTTVPEIVASYRAVKQKIPELRRNAGSKSLFEAAITLADRMYVVGGSSKTSLLRRWSNRKSSSRDEGHRSLPRAARPGSG